MSVLAQFSNLDTDTTMAGNSDMVVASQKAIKAYADSLAGALNAVTYKGAIDCSSNPNYPAADAGDLYMISVAGKIGGASGAVVEAGDMILCKTDGTATGTQAQRGTAWNIIQTNITDVVPVKATGAEVNTGTDDDKFVTALAVADSYLGDLVSAPVAFIADPTGGATTDAEARTAIGAILDLLIAKGLMAAS